MKKILTIVLNGFGMKEDIYGNAVKNAGMNYFIDLWNNYPHTLLTSHGKEIGLPADQCGDSMIGQTIINAGRKVKSRLANINEGMLQHRLQINKKYREMLDYLKRSNNSLHIVTLLSDGGISSHIGHLMFLLKELENEKISNNIYIHVISDGCDSPKLSVQKYIKFIKNVMPSNVHLASICGRSYALDQTNNYKKTELYYGMLFENRAIKTNDLNKIIDLCYEKRLSDEYLPPLQTAEFQKVDDCDVFLLWNYSHQNQLQLLSLINQQKSNVKVYSMYQLNNEKNNNYFFEDKKIENGLSEYLSNLNLQQARICESCMADDFSYALNGLSSVNISNCDTYVVETPKVDSLVKKPEMNALSLSKIIIDCMDKDYDFIIANFSNPDLLGHTGNYQATINSLQAIDVCLEKVVEAAYDNFYKVIIVGTHANVDTIVDSNNNIIPQNTDAPVPFMILDKKVRLNKGSLIDVAPTILYYMDIAIPKEMQKSEILIDDEKEY